ncbi:MAG: hypothetical protein ACXV8Q_07250 [Methylobacter sp.]
MPTYRVYLARPTTNPPVWDFATTIVRATPQQALDGAYQQWAESVAPAHLPPLAECRQQVNQVNLPAKGRKDNSYAKSTAELAGVTYTLTVVNNSSNPFNFAVFQKDPNIGVSNVFSLAWFTKYCYPGTTAKFKWTIDYNFVWCETGELIPGVIFDATQTPAAGLESNNQISLDYDSINSAYFFNPPTPSTQPPLGILRIQETPNVPLKQASVGIGMSNAGTFVVQAEPNLTLNFTPHPKYYVLAGTFTQGQVLDTSETTKAPEVAFPAGVYQMTATLNQDNTWTIRPTSSTNAQFRLAKQELGDEAQWGI